jgi:hypothetical protein
LRQGIELRGAARRSAGLFLMSALMLVMADTLKRFLFRWKRKTSTCFFVTCRTSGAGRCCGRCRRVADVGNKPRSKAFY